MFGELTPDVAFRNGANCEFELAQNMLASRDQSPGDRMAEMIGASFLPGDREETGKGAASLRIGSDVLPYSIVRVSASGGTVYARRDRATRIDRNGQCEAQRYRFETSDPRVPEEAFSLRKSGRWVKVGQPDSGHGYALTIGRRRKFEDPHF